MGEETNQIPDTDYFWLVDPIDGTNNYAMGIDYCAVTVALQRGVTTLLGVTQQIHTGRVYHARLGAGAFRREPGGEEVRLQVNTADRLGTSLLATGFPYHRAEHSDNNAAEFAHFMPRVVGLRVLGAAALDMAYVASGALAAFWEGWLGPWDAAAGALLVREAGGRVTTYTGEEWTIRRGDLVASNGQAALHQAMLEGIGEARKHDIAG
ncbi:MAG: inositol monophosphatase [Anaerolineales bacterium]|nr:inositol monophosphatase [Anaerolineales bacterium]